MLPSLRPTACASRARPLLTAAACLVALLAGACDDGDARPSQDPCTRDADCGDTQRCVDGACIESACPCTPGAGEPVCGADGRTWPSQCDAECAGVDVTQPGACFVACTSDAQCSAGKLCSATSECLPPPPGCVAGDPACDLDTCWGRCMDGPCGCSDQREPVCGTDGATYDNECRAKCAGTLVAHRGECPRCAPLVDCDASCPYGLAIDTDGCAVCACAPPWCERDDDCAEGELCDAEACQPSCVGCDDCVAVCAPPPAPCSCEHAPHAPVCTVEGETLSSACLAECRGVAIAHEGACTLYCEPLVGCELECPHGLATDAQGCPTCTCSEKPRRVCGDGRDCEAGEWCNPAACAPSCEGCDDCLPACEPVLCERCAPGWRPVCDASGWTWASACEAECVGIAQARLGACEVSCGCKPGLAVCGADGRTRESACEAACDGVAVLASGACECTSRSSCDVPDPVCTTDGTTWPCGPFEPICRGLTIRWSGTCEAPRRCEHQADCADDEYCRFDACAPSCVGCDDCSAACVPR